jgi:phytoene/squalene synthetase
MNKKSDSSSSLAMKITQEASRQTHYTIRFLADQELVPDAYRAYAYFRWVDDCLDADICSQAERIDFLNHQQHLLDLCYEGRTPNTYCSEEQMLIDLVSNDREENSGLKSYLYNMMAVMAFDVKRRDRAISQAELSEYSCMLATAVTDALHYFIGRNCPAPRSEHRYFAVWGAHIIHMLRDTVEDTENGYFNIPDEYIKAQNISFEDIDSLAYRKWVRSRIQLADLYFRDGREYIIQVKNLRCRLAGFAYTARFEWMLQTIKNDDYFLQAVYPKRKTLKAGLWITCRTLTAMLGMYKLNRRVCKLASRKNQREEL